MYNFFHKINLYLLLLLSSEVLIPKDQTVKASLQGGRYLSQAVKQPKGIYCLTGHACSFEKWGDMKTMKHEESHQPCLPKYFCRVLSWCQAQSYSQELPPVYILTDIATLLLGSVPQSQPVKTR